MTMTGVGVLDRDEAVVLLIDLQPALADVMPRREPVLRAACLLARTCAEMGVPVLVTRQYPKGLGDTVEVVRAATAGVEPVDKVAFSCLAEPAFRARLEALGRKTVLLAGMETHICVAQTALALLAEGYTVQVAADAVCSRRETDHAIALDRLRAAGAAVTTVEAAIYEALGCAGTPEFRAVLELVKAEPLG